MLASVSQVMFGFRVPPKALTFAFFSSVFFSLRKYSASFGF